MTGAGVILFLGAKRLPIAWSSISSVVAGRVPHDDKTVLIIAIGFGERVMVLVENEPCWDSFCSEAPNNLEGFAPAAEWQEALSELGQLVLYRPAPIE